MVIVAPDEAVTGDLVSLSAHIDTKYRGFRKMELLLWHPQSLNLHAIPSVGDPALSCFIMPKSLPLPCSGRQIATTSIVQTAGGRLERTEFLEAAFHVWLPFPWPVQNRSGAAICPSRIQVLFKAENRHRNKGIVPIIKMGTEPCHRNSA